MQEEPKKSKRPKNPKDWEGSETQHSHAIGDTVTVNEFGALLPGVVVELQTDYSTGLKVYRVEVKGLTRMVRLPFVGYFDHPDHPFKLVRDSQDAHEPNETGD